MKFLLLATLVTLVSCGPRRPGKIGPAGNNGQDGYSIVVNVETYTINTGVTCNRTDYFLDYDRNNYYSSQDVYKSGFIVCDGEVGQDGTNGNDGQDGTNGTNGLNADLTYAVIDIIDPCGDHPTKQDEVILKLGSGKYLASFSDNANGLNTRFSTLSPGTYQTTDGTGCVFTLN
jgi:hypothetical protein